MFAQLADSENHGRRVVTGGDALLEPLDRAYDRRRC